MPNKLRVESLSAVRPPTWAERHGQGLALQGLLQLSPHHVELSLGSRQGRLHNMRAGAGAELSCLARSECS